MSPLRTMSDGMDNSLLEEEEDAFYTMVTSFDMKDRQECYRVLGLKPGADLDEIKAAYKRLARIWHPDKYTGRRDPCLVFQHLNEAYSNLIKAPQQVGDDGGYGRQSGLSRWLDERWNWRSHRERMNWERSGRVLIDRYYLYKGEWNEEELRYRTQGLFYAHGVELGRLDLSKSSLWWRFETGIAGFEVDAVTCLARIYACDSGRLDNLTTRLLARFGAELESSVDQSAAAEAWRARKATEKEEEDSTDTTRRDSSGLSGSSRESTSGESEGQGENDRGGDGSDGGEEGFFSCTEAENDFREVKQGSDSRKDTTRKGPPRRAPPKRKQSSVASDGGAGIRTDARFERRVECPSISPVEVVGCMENQVDVKEPSVVDEEESAPDGGGFNVKVIGKDSQLEHAATYARPDDLGESPSDQSCPSPSLSSAEEWCVDGYSSAADVEKVEGVAEAAYQAQYDSRKVDRSTAVNPKFLAKMDYTAESMQQVAGNLPAFYELLAQLSLVKGELVRMKGNPVNGWALRRCTPYLALGASGDPPAADLQQIPLIHGYYLDLYDVLRLDKGASPKEIKKSYRKLAVRWHPDKHRNDFDKAFAESVFKLIARAYEVLSDEDSRADYDAGGYNAGGVFCTDGPFGGGFSCPDPTDTEAFETFFKNFFDDTDTTGKQYGEWSLNDLNNYTQLNMAHLERDSPHMVDIVKCGLRYLAAVVEEFEDKEVALLRHDRIDCIYVLIAYDMDRSLTQETFFEGYGINYYDAPLQRAIQPRWLDCNNTDGRHVDHETSSLKELSLDEFIARQEAERAHLASQGLSEDDFLFA
ncbi:hypothetical protein FOL47_003363 [Perkinsus chesapeaki]|uniref:J domain-containing protein n=1 Tax=Perkinsus chesapeaki TaxID=330153 RepID=A0A7J6M8S1_PERCH|nr:hypothetical protein FOL47_003363 [Perkinsus chesapeaki]